MKEQHNQKKLSIYVTLLIVVICLFGISFALFKFNASQATQNDITTLNCFEVEYSDVTDTISITNDYPISDAEGLKRTPYTFKIKNKCSQLLNVQIGVETLSTSQIEPNLIKGVITKKGETPTSAKLLSAGIPGTPVNGGTNYILLEDTIYGSQEKEYDLRLWFTESMTKEQGSGKTYQGKVTVISSPKTEEPVQLLTAIMRDNTVTETLTQPGKEVSAHTLDDVQVQTTSVSSTYQAYYITYGTGWEANGTKFNLTGTAVTSNTYANSYSTLVGKYLNGNLASAGSSTAGTMKTTTNLPAVYYVISATSDSFTYKILGSNKNTTEALLASTADDYGTSYYFRGAVENNYVEYANMCWRIVRVTGDGSIKLVLYNYNGLTSTNNTPSSSTPCNVTGDTYAYARYDGDTYTSRFNSSYNDNAYVGLMYGTVGASSYAAAQANTNPSTILTNLNKWYTNVLSKQANFNDSQLADTIWCNDKSVVTDPTFNPSSETLGTNYGYGANINYYSASKRLVQASSWSAGGTGPSLICPNDHTGGKLSKFTVSDTTYGNGALSGYAKVGLLTADEIAFAGGALKSSNLTYYIKGNTNSSMWWALSPGFFDGSDAGVLGVYGNHSSLVDYFVYSNYGVRPSLSLSSGVKISGGIGSATNPYKIAA